MELKNGEGFDVNKVKDMAEVWNGEFVLNSCVIQPISSVISHVLSKTKMATSVSALSAQPCGCSSPKQII